MTARPGFVYLVGAGPGDPGLLTVRAEGASEFFSSPALDRRAKFEILGAPRDAPPIFPPTALFSDAFVAYPSGRIFALGGRRTKPVDESIASEFEVAHGYMLDGALVWQTDATGGKLTAVQLPGTTPRDRLIRGQLVRGARQVGGVRLWGGVRDRTHDRERRVPLTAPSSVLEAQARHKGVAVLSCVRHMYAIERELVEVSLGRSGPESLDMDTSDQHA